MRYYRVVDISLMHVLCVELVFTSRTGCVGYAFLILLLYIPHTYFMHFSCIRYKETIRKSDAGDALPAEKHGGAGEIISFFCVPALTCRRGRFFYLTWLSG